MKYTVPIEIVVDGEQVERERATLEHMGSTPADLPKRENAVRMLGLRSREPSAISHLQLGGRRRKRKSAAAR